MQLLHRAVLLHVRVRCDAHALSLCLTIVHTFSIVQVHQYLMRIFQGRDIKSRLRGERFIVGYDDACHLKPFASNPKRLTASAPKAAHQVAHECDCVGG